MLNLTFHHIGIGTTDFYGAIACYERIGHRLHSQVVDPLLDVRVAFLTGPGGAGPWFEVVAPLGPDGPLKSLLSRRVLPAPYHTCYAVEDITQASTELKAAAFMALGAPQPALAFDNQLVAFFYSRMIGLIELVERPPSRLEALVTAGQGTRGHTTDRSASTARRFSWDEGRGIGVSLDAGVTSKS